MSIPVIKPFSAIDASVENEISLSWNGFQAFGNQIQIYKSTDGSLVYDNSVTSFILVHTIPANILTNNATSYYVKVRVFDSANNYSAWSNSIVFTCYTIPIISINIEANQIIQSSSYDCEISYTSADGEPLNTWQLLLYDSGQIQVSMTDIIYASQQMNYRISGLEDSKSYYISVTAQTVHDMSISTGLIPISVNYIQPTTFSKVELINNPDTGTIEIQSHFKNVDGKSTPSPPSYIDNSEVDLTASGSKVWFDDGFLLKGDFTKQCIVRNPLPYMPIYIATNDVETLTVRYMYGEFEDGEKAYFLLEVKNKVLTTRVATDPFDKLSDSQAVYVLIRRIDDLWSIRCFNYSVSVEKLSALNMTVDEWNEKNLTNEELRTQGSLLLS